jgi:hypothetical protein
MRPGPLRRRRSASRRAPRWILFRRFWRRRHVGASDYDTQMQSPPMDSREAFAAWVRGRLGLIERGMTYEEGELLMDVITAESVLDDLERKFGSETMPDDVCRPLSLPPGSTYLQGAAEARRLTGV